MKIGIKLGKIEELKVLLNYKGPFKCYEIPAKLLEYEDVLSELRKKEYIFTVHGESDFFNDNKEQIVQETIKQIGLCKHIGVNKIILHSLLYDNIRQWNEISISDTIEAFESIIEYAKDKSVECLIENGCFKEKGNYETTALSHIHVEIAQKLDVNMVLDLGHAALTAYSSKIELGNFLKPYIENKQKIEIIHISDNDLLEDQHCAVGDGGADLNCYENIIGKIDNALYTVETYPSGIYKTMTWLLMKLNADYTEEQIRGISREMGWN